MLTESNDRRASGMWWWYGTDKKEGGDKQLKRKRGEKAGWVDRGKYERGKTEYRKGGGKEENRGGSSSQGTNMFLILVI